MAELKENQPILTDWRQGDFCLNTSLAIPILGSDEQGIYFGSATGKGAILISQSCDIVRASSLRPYVQVAPLLEVTETELAAVVGKRRPRYVTFPALHGFGLVVDLDIVATVQKEVVAKWDRTGGCANEAERAEFAVSLARHKQRFAFPDSFDQAIKDFRRWIERRAEQNNPSGDFIRATDEIRVQCDDWSADVLALEFLCILKRDPRLGELQAWESPRADLELKIASKYPESFLRIVTKAELSLTEYQSSHYLDLDGLSDA
jgi:hypothetical protein